MPSNPRKWNVSDPALACSMESLIEKLIEDVDTRYPDDIDRLQEDWPDLAVTYKAAVGLLKQNHS